MPKVFVQKFLTPLLAERKNFWRQKLNPLFVIWLWKGYCSKYAGDIVMIAKKRARLRIWSRIADSNFTGGWKSKEIKQDLNSLVNLNCIIFNLQSETILFCSKTMEHMQSKHIICHSIPVIQRRPHKTFLLFPFVQGKSMLPVDWLLQFCSNELLSSLSWIPYICKFRRP